MITASISPKCSDPAFSLHPDIALFLDFDGTLVALQDDPDTVTLDTLVVAILDLCRQVLGGALAVLSGRDLRDLAQRVAPVHWRIGNHGLFIAPPNAPLPAIDACPPGPLVQTLIAAIADLDGVRLEAKGPVLAVHYRTAPQFRTVLAERLGAVLRGASGYSLQAGHGVFELKPQGANKGASLHQIMKNKPFVGRLPVMIGDDTTDEDAFAAAQACGGYGVKVGTGQTRADQRLCDVRAVHALLEKLAAHEHT